MQKAIFTLLIASLWASFAYAQPPDSGSFTEYLADPKTGEPLAGGKVYTETVDQKGRLKSWSKWDFGGELLESGECFYNPKGLISEKRLRYAGGEDTILYQYDYQMDGRLAKMLEGRKPGDYVLMHHYSYTGETVTDSVMEGDTLLVTIIDSRASDQKVTKIRSFEENSTRTWVYDNQGKVTEELVTAFGVTNSTLLFYDKENRLKERANEGELLKYKYDNMGRLLETRAYDDHGKVVWLKVRVYE